MIIKFFNLVVSLALVVFFYKSFFIKNLVRVKNLWEVKRKGISTRGKVTDIKEITDSDGLKLYSPVVTFIVMDNTYRFEEQDESMRKPVLGEVVNVRYSRLNPDNAIIDKPISYNFPVLLFVIGCIVLIILVTITVRNILSLIG